MREETSGSHVGSPAVEEEGNVEGEEGGGGGERRGVRPEREIVREADSAGGTMKVEDVSREGADYVHLAFISTNNK